MGQIVLLNNKRTESSDNYVKMLTCLSLRAPEGCEAISLEKTRLLRFTRNDNSYRWIREKGFTLVEVMIALVVVLVVFLALMQTALVGIDSNMINVLRDEAVSIAEQRMNEARNTAFDSLGAGSETVTRNLRNIANFPYTVTRTVADLNADNKQVDITVRWAWKGNPYAHSITTILRRQ